MAVFITVILFNYWAIDFTAPTYLHLLVWNFCLVGDNYKFLKVKDIHWYMYIPLFVSFPPSFALIQLGRVILVPFYTLFTHNYPNAIFKVGCKLRTCHCKTCNENWCFFCFFSTRWQNDSLAKHG